MPYEFDRYINGTLMAEGVTIERQNNLPDAMREAARIASRGSNGEVPVLVLRRATLSLPAGGVAALPIPEPDAQPNAGLVAARRIASEQCASAANVSIPDGGPTVTLTTAPDAQAVATISVLDWLDAEIAATPTRGSSGFDHDAYWMKTEIGGLVDKARSIFATPVTGEADVERLRSEVVFGVYEEEYPLFVQGYDKGVHELSSPVTAKECEGYVEKIKELTSRVEALTAEVGTSKAEAFEEAAQIVKAQRDVCIRRPVWKHAVATCDHILDAIRSRAASKGGAGK